MVGVLGCGSFGFTVASLLAKNSEVLTYCRNQEKAQKFNQGNEHLGYPIPEGIRATSNLAEVGASCDVIFPVIPSEFFRSLMKEMRPYLSPKHILIHATKGLDITRREHEFQSFSNLIHTMSQIVLQETDVVRVGCMAGPNLAREILEGQAAAAVIASEFYEVIDTGKKLLSSDQFYTFASTDLIGTEICSSYKNIIALAAGIIDGHEYGQNMQAILITRGLNEMMILGKAIGAKDSTFLGPAGIGDLVATSTSHKSRNFSFGRRLAQGESMESIIQSSEVVEGVRTLNIIYELSNEMNLAMPLTNVIYRIVFGHIDLDGAVKMLMKLKS